MDPRTVSPESGQNFATESVHCFRCGQSAEQTEEFEAYKVEGFASPSEYARE